MSANYPLSPSQKGIWTGQKLNPESHLYNMAWLITFDELLDHQRFSSAFQRLLASADNMRSTFHEADGRAFQRINESVDFKVDLLDFAGTAEELETWAVDKAKTPFNLTSRAFDSVLVNRDGRSVWYLNQHHLITDAWATTQAYNRLMSFYYESEDQEPASDKYPSHESHLISLAEIPSAQDESDSTYTSPPDLFGQRLNPDSTASKRISIPLSADDSKRLRELSTESPWRSFTADLSLYNLFSSLLFVYIQKISGERQLSFGAPAHNRSTADQKKIIGSFIELFSMDADVSKEDSFRDLGKKTAEATGRMMRLAKVGGSSLKSQLGFNCLLNFVNTTFESFGEGQVRSEWLDLGETDPRHLIRWHVYDYDSTGQIELRVDFNSRLQIPDLEKEGQRILIMVRSLLDDPESMIDDLELIDEGEKDFYLTKKDAVNGPSVLARILDQAEKNPDAIALSSREAETSYSDLISSAASFADDLNRLDAESKLVAIHLNRSTSYFIALIGSWLAAKSVVLLDHDSPEERTRHILSHSGAQILVSEDQNLATSETTHLLNPPKVVHKQSSPRENNSIDRQAYILYTSGSSGKPKGVSVSRGALANYINWAAQHYNFDDQSVMPFFTSPSFDLSLTSMLLPLCVGGQVRIYPSEKNALDDSVLSVFNDGDCNVVKLTPSHLEMVKNTEWKDSGISTLILGGEALKSNLAAKVKESNPAIKIYNEYGPTEATVGCVVHEYQDRREGSVPIGRPISGAMAVVLNESRKMQIPGVLGELYLGGECLAEGYWREDELTADRFVDLEFGRFYRTGDKVRLNSNGDFEFLGRIDDQIKLRGFRIEPGEIESALTLIEGVDSASIVYKEETGHKNVDRSERCVNCGLPFVYPKARIDDDGVCFYCRSFESYKNKTQDYFGDESELRKILDTGNKQADYDCIVLYSGGKDSTFALSQMVDAGYRALAFTLDNGYISDDAKANIKRVVDALGVEHVYGRTDAMNKIFVDSLNRHANVCNGCFKTIYTLSTKLALEKGISFIMTGLSRGQFFETRLTEELFENEISSEMIDLTVLEARKAYHQVDDAVKRLIDVSVFNDDETFEKVQFVDFYRYNDVSYADMMSYLDTKLPWVRPSDTGRSTNCLINDAGIYVHKKSRGYHNYAFPYSWDVRVGHKTIDETIHELEDELDESNILRILDEIGYDRSRLNQRSSGQLLAFVTGSIELDSTELRSALEKHLPDYMIPRLIQQIDQLPLSGNGKVDKSALLELADSRPQERDQTPPQNGIEEVVLEIWKDVLNLQSIGIREDFLDLGGNSLIAIQVVSRINVAFEISLALRDAFEAQNIEAVSKLIETTILKSEP